MRRCSVRTEPRLSPPVGHPSTEIGRLLRGLEPEVKITVLRLIGDRHPHQAGFVLRANGRTVAEANRIIAEIVRIQVQSGITGWE